MESRRPSSLTPRRKRWAPRSRKGCLTCRSRKLKCDEAKPVCKRCELAGLDCAGCGYLKDTPPAVSTDSDESPPSIPISPPSVPQLNGSAEVRDLIHLVPQMSAFVSHANITNPSGTMSEYIISRGQYLILYIDHLPTRLGHNAALDNSIDCVVGALRDLCIPDSSQSRYKTYSSYARALRNLQNSLEDPIDSLSAETLCATQLLGIFESLTRENGKTSNSHTKGMSQLVQLRGPKRFTTEFEKSLLISQTAIIFADSAFKATPCILDTPDWMDAIKSVGTSSPSNFDRSKLRVSIFEYLMPFSKLIGECNHLITGEYDEAQHSRLMGNSIAMRKRICGWYQRWGKYVYPPPEQEDFTEFGTGDSRGTRTHYAIMYQVFTLLYNRLYIALGGEESRELEKKTHEIAKDIINNPYVNEHAKSQSNMMIAWATSHAFLATTEEWTPHLVSAEDGALGIRPLLDVDVWKRWLILCGVHPVRETARPPPKVVEEEEVEEEL